MLPPPRPQYRTQYRARPTIYNGIQMRSRLEASFAQWLDGPGWAREWSYEPFCYASPDGQYLPDFHVYFNWLEDWEFCEVKPPNADLANALKQMHIILASEPQATLSVWTHRTDLPEGHRFSFISSHACHIRIPCGHCDRIKPSASHEQ